MSRVAKKPISVPKGVDLTIQPELVSVKGPKGTLTVIKPAEIKVNVDNGIASLSTDNPEQIALTGTLRAIVANMVHGVSQGFERKLELVGVGYRAAVQGKDLNLTLGFSHPVVFAAFIILMTSLSLTRLDAFVKSMKHKNVGLSYSMTLSIICRTMNMASVVYFSGSLFALLLLVGVLL